MSIFIPMRKESVFSELEEPSNETYGIANTFSDLITANIGHREIYSITDFDMYGAYFLQSAFYGYVTNSTAMIDGKLLTYKTAKFGDIEQFKQDMLAELASGKKYYLQTIYWYSPEPIWSNGKVTIPENKGYWVVRYAYNNQ